MAAGITLEFNSEEKRLSHSSLILSELDARMLRLSRQLCELDLLRTQRIDVDTS